MSQSGICIGFEGILITQGIKKTNLYHITLRVCLRVVESRFPAAMWDFTFLSQQENSFKTQLLGS